jgi:hypothetical protein
MDKAHGRDRGAFDCRHTRRHRAWLSSSAFTVGLLAALDPYGENLWTANIASQIEIEACKKSIGKQDQYTAAYGGLNLLGFTSKGVTVEPVACDWLHSRTLPAARHRTDAHRRRRRGAGRAAAGSR